MDDARCGRFVGQVDHIAHYGMAVHIDHGYADAIHGGVPIACRCSAAHVCTYKIVIEPIAYLVYNGANYAMTATEAALYDQVVDGNLRYWMGSLTHQNLPLAIFLTRETRCPRRRRTLLLSLGYPRG